MNCNASCKNFYYVTDATVDSGQIILTFNKAPTAKNMDRICFRLSQGVQLPSGYENLPVVANVIVEELLIPIPLLDKYGSSFTGSELINNSNNNVCHRFTYKGFIGQEFPKIGSPYHILVSNIPKITIHSNCYGNAYGN